MRFRITGKDETLHWSLMELLDFRFYTDWNQYKFEVWDGKEYQEWDQILERLLK